MFSATNSSIALRTVPMLMPNRSESRRSAGIASPGFHSPPVSAFIIWRLISLYSGVASGMPGATESLADAASRRRAADGFRAGFIMARSVAATCR